jgi:type II secretion system protein J
MKAMRLIGLRGQPRRRKAGGFTLIELLIATVLMAVLALLAWRGLDAVLVSRERIVRESDELRSLTLAFAQLDEDLRKSWPVRLLRLDSPPINFTVSGDEAIPRLELLRESGGVSESTQIQAVAWRLRNGVLERGFGVWRLPGQSMSPAVGAGTAAGSDSLVWQPILSQVSALQMQGWIAGQGWIPAETLVGQLNTGGRAPVQSGDGSQPAVVPAPVPVTGLQVRVVRDNGQVLQRTFPVRD